MAAAGAAAFFRDVAVPDGVDACADVACAGPDDDELEPPVSAEATGAPSPVAIAVPMPSATARTPILPTDMPAPATGRFVPNLRSMSVSRRRVRRLTLVGGREVRCTQIVPPQTIASEQIRQGMF